MFRVGKSFITKADIMCVSSAVYSLRGRRVCDGAKDITPSENSDNDILPSEDSDSDSDTRCIHCGHKFIKLAVQKEVWTSLFSILLYKLKFHGRTLVDLLVSTNQNLKLPPQIVGVRRLRSGVQSRN